MKTLTLLTLILSPLTALAGPFPSLDEIDTLKCTVTKSDVRSSFIPPEVGDIFFFYLRSSGIYKMESQKNADGVSSYIPHELPLERVDLPEYRNPGLRTFIGIKESVANASRSEYYLVITGSETELKAKYEEKFRSLRSGSEEIRDPVEFDCFPEKLIRP